MSRSKEDMTLIRGNIHKKWEVLGFKILNFCGRILPSSFRKNMFSNACQKILKGDGKLIHRSNDQKIGKKCILPAECMEDFMEISFENANLMITKRYHEVLVSSYGEDYMIPKEDKINTINHASMRAFLEES